MKNFVVFVNGAKQGEKAKVKITEVRNRFAIGEKVGVATGEVESPSGEAAETEEASETEETKESSESAETETEESASAEKSEEEEE